MKCQEIVKMPSQFSKAQGFVFECPVLSNKTKSKYIQFNITHPHIYRSWKTVTFGLKNY